MMLRSGLQSFFSDVAGEVPTEKPSNKPERLGIAGLALHYAHIITQIDNIVSAIHFFLSKLLVVGIL